MIRLTRDQMHELMDRFFGYTAYDVEDDIVYMDGGVHVNEILAAADWIRSVGEEVEPNKGCIYNRTLEERQIYCKLCSAACASRIKEK